MGPGDGAPTGRDDVHRSVEPPPDRPVGPREHPAGLDHPLGAPAPLPRRPLYGVLALALGAVAAVSSAFVGVGPAAVDQLVLGQAIDARSGPLTAIAVAVTEVGSTATMGVLAALVTLVLLVRSRPYDALFVAVTAVGASLVFSGLKRLLDRARPPLDDQLVGAANESLPSGHATMAVAVIGSLVVLAWVGQSAATRVAMVVGAALWVGAVGLTRVYLGVHWFSDVLAGWLVGGAWLALCAMVWATASARRRATADG
ncbi:phosphatase PAP2 family protein [Pseudonocardia humida]|uniref:Phosphatase PAP2 family protein n=1 Tax=Pseudonocardia humida TaxID=2800819 RepID=A0ABT1AD65_9PSEU|nr:phosphatase PAP2 family protein [Pseudonocardia humida]MCO1661007.1 phosphatase PAP2 family protein [Pseudonocardia humida]